MLKIVNEFEVDYDQHSPIWWYTRECFLSSIINQAFRTMDMKVIIKMGLFLRDICRQIKNIHEKKSKLLDPLTVYRCLKLNTSDFNLLQQNKDDYVSFSSFLLAHIEREFEINVCSNAQQSIDVFPVLFKIEIDPINSEFIPFASLDQLSYDSNTNNDVLFSMNSVFRIASMAKTEKNIWHVQLTGANENDYSLKLSIGFMSLLAPKEKGWNKLGQVMIFVNKLKRAEDLYKILMESIDINDKKAMNGSYDEASLFFEKELQIQKKILPSRHVDLASLYNLIGVSNSKMGKLQNAFLYYEKALKIQEEILPSNHADLAITYDNIGLLHQKLGNHVTALSYHQQALEINEEVLSSHHPDLAINYNNLAQIYTFMEDYVNALSYYEKAIRIQELILSSDNPDLAIVYDNIGGVYEKMNEFDKALLFYRKALKINEKVLNSNHPDLAVTYNNIGNIKFYLEDYSSAMLFYRKALQIQQTSLSRNHPYIANTYNSIGIVYKSMREFSNALSYYEKALQIQETSLSPNHSDFMTTYMNLGALYYNTGKYSTSLSYFERALKIGQVSLPENHSTMKRLQKYIAILEKEL
ncbi:unnamed protein product [Rotaria sp. Silwood2]|nr:unnamed protein product [Rotaria sp. Silwood2]